jgi:hypothetical protein
MRHPVSVWLLVVTLIVLALGGLAGAFGFLSDPSGTGMGMSVQLERLPVPDYTLPGIFLLVVMCIFPLLLVYGLLVRSRWKLLDPVVVWSNQHWAWVGSLVLGLGVALWLAIQALYIGFSAPIQWFTAFLGLSILVTTLVTPTRKHYRWAQP